MFTYAGDPCRIGIDKRLRSASPIAPGALDVDWIPVIAANGWIVITKDRHMRSRPAEQELIRDAQARHIRIEGPPTQRKLRKWDQLVILLNQWQAIERLVDEPGSWIYVASRTRLRRELWDLRSFSQLRSRKPGRSESRAPSGISTADHDGD